MLVHCRLCSGDYVYAYLHDEDAPEVASPNTSGDDRLKPGTSHLHSYSSTSIDVDSQLSASDEHSSDISVQAKKARTVSNVKVLKEASAATSKLDKEFRPAGGASDATNRWTLLSGSCSASSSQVSSYSETSNSQSSLHVSTDIGTEDFLLHPGSFRILLCVDNQEFYAKYVSEFLCDVIDFLFTLEA